MDFMGLPLKKRRIIFFVIYRKWIFYSHRRTALQFSIEIARLHAFWIIPSAIYILLPNVTWHPIWTSNFFLILSAVSYTHLASRQTTWPAWGARLRPHMQVPAATSRTLSVFSGAVLRIVSSKYSCFVKWSFAESVSYTHLLTEWSRHGGGKIS